MSVSLPAFRKGRNLWLGICLFSVVGLGFVTASILFFAGYGSRPRVQSTYWSVTTTVSIETLSDMYLSDEDHIPITAINPFCDDALHCRYQLVEYQTLHTHEDTGSGTMIITTDLNPSNPDEKVVVSEPEYFIVLEYADKKTKKVKVNREKYLHTNLGEHFDEK